MTAALIDHPTEDRAPTDAPSLLAPSPRRLMSHPSTAADVNPALTPSSAAS